MKSLSGGQFSPIPKGLMEKMATMSLKKHGNSTTGHNIHKKSPHLSQVQKHVHTTPNTQMVTQFHPGSIETQGNQLAKNPTKHTINKRKLDIASPKEDNIIETLIHDTYMVGLINKASQPQ